DTVNLNLGSIGFNVRTDLTVDLSNGANTFDLTTSGMARVGDLTLDLTGGAEIDTVDINLGSIAGSAQTDLTLDLGAGADDVTVSASNVGKNAHVNVNLDAGLDSDTVDLVFANLKSGARLNLATNLEDGAGTFNLTLNGTLNPHARVNVDLTGGTGDDTASLTLSDASFKHRVHSRIAADVEHVTGF